MPKCAARLSERHRKDLPATIWHQSLLLEPPPTMRSSLATAPCSSMRRMPAYRENVAPSRAARYSRPARKHLRSPCEPWQPCPPERWAALPPTTNQPAGVPGQAPAQQLHHHDSSCAEAQMSKRSCPPIGEPQDGATCMRKVGRALPCTPAHPLPVILLMRSIQAWSLSAAIHEHLFADAYGREFMPYHFS